MSGRIVFTPSDFHKCTQPPPMATEFGSIWLCDVCGTHWILGHDQYTVVTWYQIPGDEVIKDYEQIYLTYKDVWDRMAKKERVAQVRNALRKA